MAPTLDELQAEKDARAELIRTFALSHLTKWRRAYSREVRDALCQDCGLLRSEFSVQHVAVELRAMEEQGLLESELEQGPRLLRRYYRLKGTRS